MGRELQSLRVSEGRRRWKRKRRLERSREMATCQDPFKLRYEVAKDVTADRANDSTSFSSKVSLVTSGASAWCSTLYFAEIHPCVSRPLICSHRSCLSFAHSYSVSPPLLLLVDLFSQRISKAEYDLTNNVWDKISAKSKASLSPRVPAQVADGRCAGVRAAAAGGDVAPSV
eukprot:755271-Hanusia_phi.AAC.1